MPSFIRLAIAWRRGPAARGWWSSALPALVLLGPLRADPDDLLVGTVQGLDEGGEGVGTLMTSGVRATSFAVVGDYGTGTITEARVAEMVRQWNPDFVATVGDNNYGPLSPNPQDFNPPLTFWSRYVGAFYGQFIKGRSDVRYGEQTAAEQRFFPAVGNHDSEDGDEEGLFPSSSADGGTIRGYLAYFHENPGGTHRLPIDRDAVHTEDVSYYAVRRGPVDLFVLDSDAIHKPGLIEAQKSWLSQCIAASNARWKIAAFHQPPHTSSFRGGAVWMRWGELRLLDAIFCGHDHFYERLQLDNDGPPIFIAGAGGQGLYAAGVLVPESRFLNNSLHGALLVRATDDGMTFEFRGLPAFVGDEQLVESFSLGAPVVDDFEDAYRFFAEAGQQIRVETRTPPPPGPVPLDLAVRISEVNGVHILNATDGAPDGRNVVATARVRSTGWHRLVVSAQAAGTGGYRVVVQVLDPLGGLAGWLDRQFPLGGESALPLADPEGDRLPNVVEYALAWNPGSYDSTDPIRIYPDQAGATGAMSLELDVPSPSPPDVSLQIEMSSDLATPAWIQVAHRPILGDWQSPAPLATQWLAEDWRRITVKIPGGPQQRFFRLRATRS